MMSRLISLHFLDFQVNVIEDKRKFDIMEFVSIRSSKEERNLLTKQGGEGRRGVSLLSSAPCPPCPSGAAFGRGPGYLLPAGP